MLKKLLQLIILKISGNILESLILVDSIKIFVKLYIYFKYKI